MAKTFRSICEGFFELEHDLGLLDWRMEGVQVWPLIRFGISMRARESAGVMGHAHPGADHWPKRGPHERVIRILNRIGAAALRQWPGHAKAVILASGRTIAGADIYSKAILDSLQSDAVVFDTRQTGTMLTGAYDLDAMKSGFGRRERPRTTTADAKLSNAVAERLGRLVGQDAEPILPRVVSALAGFIRRRSAWELYFRRAQTRALFVVCSYTRQAAVAAARATGVRVIEPQHGNISPYHLGYSWPGRPVIETAPDEFWTFGQYWCESTEFAKGVSTRVIGAPHIDTLGKVGINRTRSRSVVFCSQGPVADVLWSLAIDVARLRPDLRVIYRLHPSESTARYTGMISMIGDRPLNLEISSGNPSTYELLATSGAQVGVYSTTLFEGLKLGCPAIVFDTPGAEHMEPAVRRGDMRLGRTAAEIAEAVDTALREPGSEDACYYYADAVDIREFVQDAVAGGR